MTRFLVLFLSIAFILNWFWEMFQMPAYAELAGKSWRQTAGVCLLATAGDAIMTLGIYVLIASLLRDWNWGIKPEIEWRIYIAVSALGMLFAVLVEKLALRANQWSYTHQMPVIPGLEIGLWPFIQLAFLSLTALWMTRALLLGKGAGNE